MTTGTRVTIKSEGPFFERRNKIVRDTMNNAINNLLQLGEQRLDKVLRPRDTRPGVFKTRAQAGKQASTGHYRRNVHADMKKASSFAKTTSAVGKIHDSGVVYGPWLEGTSSRNLSTRFPGYSSFRRTKDYLDKLSPKILNAHIKKATKQMNGK